MTAKEKLHKLLPVRKIFDCRKCPIPQQTCRSLVKTLYNDERCLLRVVLSEILVFRADLLDKKKVSV